MKWRHLRSGTDEGERGAGHGWPAGDSWWRSLLGAGSPFSSLLEALSRRGAFFGRGCLNDMMMGRGCRMQRAIAEGGGRPQATQAKGTIPSYRYRRFSVVGRMERSAGVAYYYY